VTWWLGVAWGRARRARGSRGIGAGGGGTEREIRGRERLRESEREGLSPSPRGDGPLRLPEGGVMRLRVRSVARGSHTLSSSQGDLAWAAGSTGCREPRDNPLSILLLAGMNHHLRRPLFLKHCLVFSEANVTLSGSLARACTI